MLKSDAKLVCFIEHVATTANFWMWGRVLGQLGATVKNTKCMWIKKKNKKGERPTVNGHFLPSPGCHGDLMTHLQYRVPVDVSYLLG